MSSIARDAAVRRMEAQGQAKPLTQEGPEQVGGVNLYSLCLRHLIVREPS